MEKSSRIREVYEAPYDNVAIPTVDARVYHRLTSHFSKTALTSELNGMRGIVESQHSVK